MGSFQRALQIIGKVFFKFRISFRIFGRKLKKIKTYSEAWNIDQSAMCCILMDLSGQALQTKGKLSWNFKFVFELFAENWKIFNA